MIRTLRSVRFLFTAPFILLLLLVIDAMTSPGHWWIQWAAPGIGIAWVWRCCAWSAPRSWSVARRP